MTISVSCRDTTLFKHTYRDRISITHAYLPAGIYTVTASHDFIVHVMANDPNVLFIDIVGKALPEAGTDFINQAFNRINKAQTAFPSLTGQSITVSIKELSFDINNIDILNRWFTTDLTATETSQHATTMATIIGGGGNSSPATKGVAPAVTLTSSDYTNLLPDPNSFFTEHSITIQNHSYGVDVENYYGNEAAAYDQQVNNVPALLHIFSAGNSGRSVPDDGTYKDLPWANLSGNFKHAKNAILVTAVDTTLRVNALNSRGPAYDGRLKPELTAFGQDGTSDAAALVSGVTTLLEEEYVDINGTKPSAALLKAVLIASADDIGEEGIDYTYGYGSVNAYQALRIIENKQNSEAIVTSNGQADIAITVPAGASSLRVAVAWTDVAAVPNSAKALVHDIDASLSLGGDTWLPWTLRSAPNIDSLTAAPRRRKDHLNTVEYITLDAPAAGTYTLTITAPQLTTPQQAVAAAWWIEDRIPFTWDYPTSKDNLETGRQVNLFWTHHTTATGKLSLQLNNGSWTSLQQPIDLRQPFHWTPPDTLATARLKMEIDGQDYLSDIFTLSPPQALHVAYNCDDALALTWTPVPGADEYVLYTLGDTYLQKIFTTHDTTTTLTKPIGPYFAVAARFDTHTAIKSPTIQYTNQGALCYINLFEALRQDNEHVSIQLNLSTWLNIDHVTIYKTAANQRKAFTTFKPGQKVQFDWTDASLLPDSMIYEAEVTLTNGAIIRSDKSGVWIETKGKAELFPNPVTDNGLVTILSEGNGVSARVTDDLGRTMLTQTLFERTETIDLSKVKKGLYILQLLNVEGKVTWSSRIVKY